MTQLEGTILAKSTFFSLFDDSFIIAIHLSFSWQWKEPLAEASRVDFRLMGVADLPELTWSSNGRVNQAVMLKDSLCLHPFSDEEAIRWVSRNIAGIE